MRLATIPVALALAALCASPALATFPGGNGEIAFVRAGDIWAINGDGTGLHQITTGPQPEFDPAWSPDGTRIAFSRGANGNRNIWTAAPDGSDQKQLTTTDANESAPAWSPDGKRILFSRFRAMIMGSDQYVIDRDGTNEHFVFEQASRADWSPAGERIAVQLGLSEASRIGFVGAEGQEYGDLPTDRSSDGRGIDGGPSWAPDGSRLVYSRARYDDEDQLSAALVINAFSRAEKVLQSGTSTAYEPTWSPDGGSIAYLANAQIWVIPSAGGTPRQITTNPAGASAPAWRSIPAAVPVQPTSPVAPSPGPGASAGPVPITRLRVLKLTVPSRVRLGSRVAVVLRFAGVPTGRVTLQRKSRGAFRTLTSIRPKGSLVTLRFRAAAAGRQHLRVVFRTGGALVRKPLTVLVRPG